MIYSSGVLSMGFEEGLEAVYTVVKLLAVVVLVCSSLVCPVSPF